MTARKELLLDSADLVDGARNAEYGEPISDFTCQSDLWQAYLARTMEVRGGLDIRPHDVAVLMTLTKCARIAESPGKRDHWVDIAGYAACGWDVAGAVRDDELGSVHDWRVSLP